MQISEGDARRFTQMVQCGSPVVGHAFHLGYGQRGFIDRMRVEGHRGALAIVIRLTNMIYPDKMAYSSFIRVARCTHAIGALPDPG
jgi:hypothetical protein